MKLLIILSADKLLKIGLDGFQQKYHILFLEENNKGCFARAISSIPMVMLMDEPFSGLDKRLRDEKEMKPLKYLEMKGCIISNT